MAKKKSTGPAEQSTKQRIRAAALHEFSEKGFSGARVERIARTANVNIRMIYYFFGSKKGLLEDVLSEIFLQRKAQLVATYDSVADLLASYFDGYSEDPQRVRLLEWEALQTKLPESTALLTNFKDRQEVIGKRIASIAKLQERGIIPAELDAKLLYLIFVALSIYPMTFPQSVFIATGEHSTTADFRQKYREFLRALGNALFPPQDGQ
jgi:TetR/AcrR family transcriptional regulator